MPVIGIVRIVPCVESARGGSSGEAMRRRTLRRVAALGAIAAFVATAPAEGSHQSMAFSGRCPLDVIFPLSVDAGRAREYVPANYTISTEATGRAVVVISLVACEDTVVDGVTRSQALYSDLLFQVDPPPGSPSTAHALDAYWAWVVTDEVLVHTRLSSLGMFHGFDPNISLTATRAPIDGRVLAVDGEVRWPHSPFRLHGDVLDLTPLGIPEYNNHFWQDVRGGRMLARLTKRPEAGPVGEEGRLAVFTLTAPMGTTLARLLADQCRTDGPGCTVSGPGFVTQLPRFDYGITVLHDRTPPNCAGKAATITGTPGDDTIPGTRGADVIVGGGGDDRIGGRAAADTICGNKGNDALRGGGSRDRLVGGRGADRCRGGRGRDTAASCEKRRGIP
jgi:hypothetical protein